MRKFVRWDWGRIRLSFDTVTSVSALLRKEVGDEDQAVAALKHDANEDAGQSHSSIAKRFGG